MVLERGKLPSFLAFPLPPRLILALPSINIAWQIMGRGARACHKKGGEEKVVGLRWSRRSVFSLSIAHLVSVFGQRNHVREEHERDSGCNITASNATPILPSRRLFFAEPRVHVGSL